MKKSYLKTTGLVFLTAALMTASLYAQPFRGGNRDGQGCGFGPCGQAYGHGPGQEADRFYGKGAGPGFALDLDEEQQEQLKNLRLEHYKEMKPLRNQMTELKAREKTLMSEENVDVKALNSVIDSETELLNRIMKIRAEHQISVRDILTDEQVMKLDQRMNFRGHHRGGCRNCPARNTMGNT
ncbi:MAG: periplasmic heavy metal sensor [Bacteroidetes bacterium]|nr:MAG: periplasmic heavy metal sensor [Bacteroidota bacterium]